MAKENLLYFAAADVNTGGSTAAREGIAIPASRYMGADPVSATVTKFKFSSVEGTDGSSIEISLTHGSGNNKTIIKQFMAAMNSNPGDGFVVMADSDVAGSSKSSEYSPIFNGDVTTVAIAEAASVGDAGTYGAGAIGTSSFGAPRTTRYIENGGIVTKILVDITGLGGKGAAADDVIGLPSGGAAYVARNVVATNGVIFKMTVSCIEAPAAASGSATSDIDMAWNSSATLAYDGAAGTSELNMATLVAGETFELNAPALTANDYLYFTEGDTAATDGVYNAGQFIITLYGHALLS